MILSSSRMTSSESVITARDGASGHQLSPRTLSPPTLFAACNFQLASRTFSSFLRFQFATFPFAVPAEIIPKRTRFKKSLDHSQPLFRLAVTHSIESLESKPLLVNSEIVPLSSVSKSQIRISLEYFKNFQKKNAVPTQSHPFLSSPPELRLWALLFHW